MANNEDIQQFTITELFTSNDKYRIPIYQRNYAWGKGEVEQLIQDILDFSIENKNLVPKKNYYIGTLVVYKRIENEQTIYETIDGQQRLTTLSILLSVLNNHGLKLKLSRLLSYESRESSNRTFNEIYKELDIKNKFKGDNYNTTMQEAYININTKLEEIKANDNLETFKNYLLNNVEILRVCVPKDTDLNHYFEIMNNRGEQLEKHEVLKSYMLNPLNKNKKEQIIFSKIWEACSDMNRYVQYGFSTDERKEIFGEEWDEFETESFDDILKKLNQESTNNEDTEENKPKTLEDIIKLDEITFNNESDKKISERFISPINFQNFLLHVLRILIMNDKSSNKEDIILDDKKLIDNFNKYIKTQHEDNNKKFVKKFAFNLLKLRFLFDNYVIKREYTSKTGEDGQWSLLKAYKYTQKEQQSIQYKNSFGDDNNDKNNKQLIMIISMFHVSNPSMIYKHWLSGVLNYLAKENIYDVKADEYIAYLKELAKKFFRNRYLAKETNEYKEIIFDNIGINKDIEIKNLNQGTKVENFIFNYLDYILWSKNEGSYGKFSFTFKSSVEHVYPQHPKDGQESLDTEILDSFGNLCLISSSKNSALSNYQPIAKKDHYNKSGYDSLKQELMMKNVDSGWGGKEIAEHQNKMLEVLGLK